MTNRRAKRLITLLLLLLLTLLGYIQAVPDQKRTGVLEQAAQNQPGMYRVVEVDDGDTVTLEMNGRHETVRFIGVDTPEKNHPEKPVQCFAEAASKFLQDRLGKQPVRLEADPINSNRDRYNRLLRYVYLPDGTLLNAEIIKEGYGFAYLAFAFEKQAEFSTLEEAAKAAGRGLWSGCRVEYVDGQVQTNEAEP